jgi:hypothetical protein
MSGHVEEPVAGVPFLRKPFKLEDMTVRVRQLVTGAEKSA